MIISLEILDELRTNHDEILNLNIKKCSYLYNKYGCKL